MKKTTGISTSEFEAQARKTVSLAFALCESRKKANKYNLTPELQALSAAVSALEKAVGAFGAVVNLCK